MSVLESEMPDASGERVAVPPERDSDAQFKRKSV
jgi:hypothetical protein